VTAKKRQYSLIIGGWLYGQLMPSRKLAAAKKLNRRL